MRMIIAHAAKGPVTKSFLDPIAGLGELANIRVWFPIAMLEERGGHGRVAGGMKNI